MTNKDDEIVAHIDDYRPDPHIVIEGPGRAHVVPQALIENLIAGEVAFADVEDPDMLRDILAHWLSEVI